MKSTTCLLDPIPTNLFKACFSVWCPTILSIINKSLETGVVPAVLETAAVMPVTKKYNVPVGDFNNFRPISNLPCLAKVLERVVASQL